MQGKSPRSAQASLTQHTLIDRHNYVSLGLTPNVIAQHPLVASFSKVTQLGRSASLVRCIRGMLTSYQVHNKIRVFGITSLRFDSLLASVLFSDYFESLDGRPDGSRSAFFARHGSFGMPGSVHRSHLPWAEIPCS